MSVTPAMAIWFIVDQSAPATGEIIFRLIKSQGLPFDQEIAENLYVAISPTPGRFNIQKPARARLKSLRG